MAPGRRNGPMVAATVTRRTILSAAALGATALPLAFVRGARGAPEVAPSGKLVLSLFLNT